MSHELGCQNVQSSKLSCDGWALCSPQYHKHCLFPLGTALISCWGISMPDQLWLKLSSRLLIWTQFSIMIIKIRKGNKLYKSSSTAPTHPPCTYRAGLVKTNIRQTKNAKEAQETVIILKNEWMNEWTNKRMNKWMNELPLYTHFTHWIIKEPKCQAEMPILSIHLGLSILIYMQIQPLLNSPRRFIQ